MYFVIVVMKQAMVNFFHFRDLKESRWWVHQAPLGYQVHQVSQVMVDKDQLDHLDHQGLQDLLRHTRDMAQVQYFCIASTATPL